MNSAPQPNDSKPESPPETDSTGEGGSPAPRSSLIKAIIATIALLIVGLAIFFTLFRMHRTSTSNKRDEQLGQPDPAASKMKKEWEAFSKNNITAKPASFTRVDPPRDPKIHRSGRPISPLHFTFSAAHRHERNYFERHDGSLGLYEGQGISWAISEDKSMLLLSRDISNIGSDNAATPLSAYLVGSFHRFYSEKVVGDFGSISCDKPHIIAHLLSSLLRDAVNVCGTADFTLVFKEQNSKMVLVWNFGKNQVIIHDKDRNVEGLVPTSSSQITIKRGVAAPTFDQLLTSAVFRQFDYAEGYGLILGTVDAMIRINPETLSRKGDALDILKGFSEPVSNLIALIRLQL
jgi:hypothetical protein